MARPLAYSPPQQGPGEDAFTAADDLARLLETLHTSGTLRVLNGVVARLDVVAGAALAGLDTPEGSRGLANVLLLARLLGQVDSAGLDRFLTALDRGLGDAGTRLMEKNEPPGTLSTLGRLRDPDVRRGLDAVLTLLGTLGRELRADTPPPATP